MEKPSPGPRQLALPAQVLPGLRHAIRREAGEEGAGRALHDAGVLAGELLHEEMDRGEERAGEMDVDSFWTALASALGRRGWGTLRVEERHPGLGFLASDDWAEGMADPEGERACPFTAGLLSGLLSRVAGERVAVLDLTGYGGTGGKCAFLFGAEPVVRSVHDRIRRGDALEPVLSSLA